MKEDKGESAYGFLSGGKMMCKWIFYYLPPAVFKVVNFFSFFSHIILYNLMIT